MTSEADVLASVPNQLFIDGVWRSAEGGATFDVTDPSTGARVAAVAEASVADGLAALSAADAAFRDWSSTPARERAELLRAAFDALQERADEFAMLMTLEMGKPLAEARGEVAYGSEFLRWFSEESPRIQGRYGPNPEGSGRMVVTRHPVGPCFLITPWNFPLAMATRKIAPALAAGCTAVVKPAELTPLTTLLFVKLLEEVGLPRGVVNVITTTRAGEVSEPIIRDPRLRKLSFTGSTPVGVRLMEQAAQGVLKTSMELGGNAPFLVFDDADLDIAVAEAMRAKFRNIGQACTAANRFFVHEAVAQEFIERVAKEVSGLRVGRGTDPGVTVGPLIDHRAVAKVEELVTDAVAHGATLHLGGHALPGDGHFFEPTLLSSADITPRLFTEEIFGPVLAVTTFRDEDEAVRLANATEYGLASYVFTRDLRRGQRLIERLQTGMMGLNTGVVSNAAAPFGGWKRSGLGREGASEGLNEYLETKYTLTPDPFL